MDEFCFLFSSGIHLKNNCKEKHILSLPTTQVGFMFNTLFFGVYQKRTCVSGSR
jgi:hypothetical protein